MKKLSTKAIQWFSVLAPQTTSTLIELLFFKTPRRPKLSKEEAAFFKTGYLSHLDVEGRNVKVWSWGSGPTIIVAHGWGSRAGRLTPLIQNLLNSGFSVVTFDAPGHGESAGYSTSLLEYSKVLRAIAQWAGPVHAIIGHSFGGVSLAYALKQGLKINKAIIIASPSKMDGYFDNFASKVGFSEKTAQTIKSNIEKKLQIRFDDINIKNYAHELNTPLLVIHDTNDKEVDVQQAHVIIKHWRGSQLFQTEGLGHNRIARSPEVASKISVFLK